MSEDKEVEKQKLNICLPTILFKERYPSPYQKLNLTTGLSYLNLIFKKFVIDTYSLII